MPAILEKCVLELTNAGKSKSSAYAICTSALQKAGKLPSQEFGEGDKIWLGEVLDSLTAKEMDKNIAHDIIHRYNGNTSEKCSVCNGTLDDEGAQKEAIRIVEEQVGRGGMPSAAYMAMEVNAGEWSTAQVNDFPDSSFAYISPGGEKDSGGKTTPRSLRHLPYKDADGKPDLAHVRNALARVNQVKDMPASKKTSVASMLQGILEKENKKGSERITGLTDLFSYMKGNDSLPDIIQVMPIGKFNTLKYGELDISEKDLLQMAENFNKDISEGVPLRAGVPIDVDHDQGKAAGWIKSLKVMSDGLYADVEWTKYGEELLANKEYRFLSPEFDPNYTDPEHSDIVIPNVLIAASLVNRPLFKELKPLVAHEELTKDKKGATIISGMELDKVLLKDPATLLAEEKDFLKANADKLTEDQKITFGITADESDEAKAKAKAKAEEEAKAKAKAEEEAKAKAKAEEDAKEAAKKAAEAGVAPDAGVTGKEDKVTIKASELQGLMKMKEEFETKKLSDQVAGWTLSEKGGKILGKDADAFVNFMKTLSEDQKKTFSELMGLVPDKGAAMFSEVGGATSSGDAGKGVEVVDQKAKALMASDGKLTYAEATKRVLASEPGLAQTATEAMTPIKSRIAV